MLPLTDLRISFASSCAVCNRSSAIAVLPSAELAQQNRQRSASCIVALIGGRGSCQGRGLQGGRAGGCAGKAVLALCGECKVSVSIHRRCSGRSHGLAVVGADDNMGPHLLLLLDHYCQRCWSGLKRLSFHASRSSEPRPCRSPDELYASTMQTQMIF